MVLTNVKQKRKKNLEEADDENAPDKYLAYVIKPKKGKAAMESASVPSTSRSDPTTERQKVKTKKGKKQREAGGSQEDSDSPLNVFISAKPHLYQAASKSRVTSATAKKSAKGKSKNQKTFNAALANWTVDEATGMEFIAPKTTMRPTKHGKEVPMTYSVPKKFEYDINVPKPNFNFDMKPVVYEACLKKPSSFYLPDVLKDKKPSPKVQGFKAKLSSWNKKIVETASSDTGSCVDLEIQEDTANPAKSPATAAKLTDSLGTQANNKASKSTERPAATVNLTECFSTKTNTASKSTAQPATPINLTECFGTKTNMASKSTIQPTTPINLTECFGTKTNTASKSTAQPATSINLTECFGTKTNMASKSTNQRTTPINLTECFGTKINTASKSTAQPTNPVILAESFSTNCKISKASNSTDQPATSSKFTGNSNAQTNQVSKADNSNAEQNKISNAGEDPNISDAMKEFYEEVTKSFDDLATKASSGTKKSKKKSALSVDESVRDERTLANIVSRNTFQLEYEAARYPQNVAQFFSLESKVILVLTPSAQFSFLGKLKIRVLYGAVELYGCSFNSQNTLKPVEVYSPRGYSSISISTSKSEGTNDKEALWDCLTAEGVDRSLKTKLHDTIRDCNDGWSVLLLENFDNTLTNFLNCYSTFKLFPKIENNRYSWCDPKRAECILQSYFQFANSTDEISICPQWNENVTKQLLERWKSTKSMTAVMTGGKNVGKSTTARYLINNLLRHSEKVILLDLDIGQAEMALPGSVSLSVIDEPLLGPNFTHLKMPYYQLYLEDVSVQNCMTRYIECANKLVECLKSKKELSGYPVIVNTMGFCKGIGLDICIYLIKLIQPSNIVQITSKRLKNNFDFPLVKQTINEFKTSSFLLRADDKVFGRICDYELHCVPSVAEGKRQLETWNMEPRQQRELVLLSYLSQIIRNADDKNFCTFSSSSINNIVPYTLPFSSSYITLIKSNTSPTHVLAAMNGNIVALCGADLDDETMNGDKTVNYPTVVLKPPVSTCYGYGIVRGIDMERREIYINTPLKESELRHVNLLAGCTPVPLTLLQQGAPYAGGRGELPTSQQPRRGNYRVDQSRNA